LERLRTFCEVADAGGMAKAAGRGCGEAKSIQSAD
jgi:hypothetical protein